MPGSGVLMCGIFAACVVAFYCERRFSPVPTPIQKWARENGYQILRCRFHYCRGPFGWEDAYLGLNVYLVRLTDAQSLERSVWLRCVEEGRYASDRVDVIWGHRWATPQAHARGG